MFVNDILAEAVGFVSILQTARALHARLRIRPEAQLSPCSPALLRKTKSRFSAAFCLKLGGDGRLRAPSLKRAGGLRQQAAPLRRAHAHAIADAPRFGDGIGRELGLRIRLHDIGVGRIVGSRRHRGKGLVAG